LAALEQQPVRILVVDDIERNLVARAARRRDRVSHIVAAAGNKAIIKGGSDDRQAD
jgi:hypothetical protein